MESAKNTISNKPETCDDSRSDDGKLVSRSPKNLTKPSKYWAREKKKEKSKENDGKFSPVKGFEFDRSSEQLIDDPMEKLVAQIAGTSKTMKIEPNLAESGCTFKPKITPRASSRGRDRPASPFSERLYASTGAGQPKSTPAERYSFQPKISKKASSIDRNDGEDVGSRLYEKDKEIKEKLKHSKEALDERAKAECPFTPQVVATRSASVGRSRPPSISKSSVSSSHTMEKTQRYEDSQNNRLKEFRRMKVEVASPPPNAAKSAAAAADGPHSESQSGASEEVFHEAAIENGNSNPGLFVDTASGSVGHTTNVFQRLSTQPNTPSVNATAMKNKDFTFHPQISKHARGSTPTRRDSAENLHERLYKEAEKKKKDLEDLTKHAEEERTKAITFSPTLPSRSSSNNSGGKSAGDGANGAEAMNKDLFERLAKPKQENVQLREERELQGCTFHPAIPGFGESGTSRGAVPVHLRLLQEAERAKELARQREELKKETELKDATFRPAISAAAKHLTRASSEMSVHERLNREAEVLREEAKRREEQRLLEEAKIMKSKTKATASKSTHDQKEEISVFERLQQDVEKHQKELEHRAQLKVQQELKDATFSPSVSSTKGKHSFFSVSRSESQDAEITASSGVRAGDTTNGSDFHTNKLNGSFDAEDSFGPEKSVSLGDFVEPTPKSVKSNSQFPSEPEVGSSPMGFRSMRPATLNLGDFTSTPPSRPSGRKSYDSPTASSAAYAVSKKQLSTGKLPVSATYSSDVAKSQRTSPDAVAPKLSNAAKRVPSEKGLTADDQSGTPTRKKDLTRTNSAPAGWFVDGETRREELSGGAAVNEIGVGNGVGSPDAADEASSCDSSKRKTPTPMPTPVFISLKSGVEPPSEQVLSHHDDFGSDHQNGSRPNHDVSAPVDSEEADEESQEYQDKLASVSSKVKQGMLEQGVNELVIESTSPPRKPSLSEEIILSSPGVAVRALPLPR